LRQDGAVDALRGQHVNVVELCELLGCKRFCRSEYPVSGIVQDHIDATLIGKDFCNRPVD
jgi:hypothetical protein